MVWVITHHLCNIVRLGGKHMQYREKTAAGHDHFDAEMTDEVRYSIPPQQRCSQDGIYYKRYAANVSHSERV
eukprot:CAMPEP_0172824478 /NCGR_PEP_ID=MMETSP1075-20121228/18038_1 /TAXON_ID=2916 /ORGANISM="Ceratium fusus, Strain PA161109" /LENGTH=71 /DNA_ID=CAMNT_0013665763 /DNA_START=78 /DNA_END=289 /DNA_ORIENTATION=-